VAELQPPPTWALPVITDEGTGQSTFNPVWLKWFIDLTAILNAAGGASGLDHNLLTGIQGGDTNERYHLTSADSSIVVNKTFQAAWSAVTPLNTPTYTQLQQMHNLTRAAGQLDNGAITDGGSETIDVSAGQGLIRATDDDTSVLYSFDWPAASGLSIPTDSIRYVAVEYNIGSPQVALYTDETYNYRTAFPLGFVINEGGTLYINSTPHSIGRGVGRLLRRNYEVDGRSRANQIGGLQLGESGTRNVVVTSGVTWLRGLREVFASFDTSSAGSFDRYYQDNPTGWKIEPGETQFPNTTYDDGSGTLQTLTNNRFGVYWFYLGPAGGIAMIYGRGNYINVAQAQTEGAPAEVPLRLQTGSLLLGRIIIEKDASSASLIESAFTTLFTPSLVQQHNNLAGLQGGTAGEFFHLTNAQQLLLTGNQGKNKAFAGPITGADAPPTFKYWVAHKRTVAVAEVLTVDADFSLVLAGSLTNNGTVVNNGAIAVV
jgi:hypothetical protein